MSEKQETPRLVFFDTKFKEHPEYKGYFVSKCGKILSTWSSPIITRNSKGQIKTTKRVSTGPPHLLAQHPRNKDQAHLFVVVYNNKKRINKFVHTLVLETYIGHKPTQKHVTLHNDNNPKNNNIKNLRWGTQKENMNDKKRHGTEQKGESHPLNKLNKQQVKLIKNMRLLGWGFGKTNKLFSNLYNVTTSCISNIYYNKNWSHVLPSTYS